MNEIKNQCKRILALMLCVALNATCFGGMLGDYRSVNEVEAADIKTNNIVTLKDSSEPIDVYSNLELYGDAIITDDGSIQLTPLSTWCSGSAWYKYKIDSKYGFTTSFSFWAGGGRNYSYGGADGIVLTFSATEGLGEDGGYLGFVNGSDNYGIELDSFSNTYDPYSKHIAIIQGKTSNHLTYKIDDRVDDSSWHKLKVEYIEETLNVYLDEALILSQKNVVLPNEIYLGVSAATGAGKNRHLIKDFNIANYRVSKISKDNYCLEFLDEKGEALENVNVTFDNQTGITDKYGEVQFHISNINSTPIIKASKENYRIFDTTNLNYKLSRDMYDSIILLSTTADPLSLSSVQYSVAADMSFPTNLRTKTKKLNLKNNGNQIGDLTNGKFYIQCKSLEENQVSCYQLWQGTTKITECKTGLFELNVSDGFVSGGNCYIRAIGKLGNTCDTPINLKFVENHVNKTDSMKLGEKITFTVGDDSIPYFGASTIEIDYPLIPLDFEISEEKIHIGFNIDLSPDDDNDPDKKIQEVKKTMETLKKFKNNLDKKNKNIVNRMIKHSEPLKLPGGDFDVKVIGYGEGDIESSEIKAELYVLMEAQTKTFGFNTMISVIPVTVQVNAGCEGTFGGEFTYNWSKNTTDKGLKLSISPELNAFGGVGIGEAVGIGAYGTAKVDIEGQVLGTNSGLRKIDLTGELGLKAYLAFLTYERAFAHNTWHLYSENEINESSINASNNIENNPYEADNYKVESLDYLYEEEILEYNEPSVLSSNEETEFTTLITNTYRNAQPVMVSNGEILLAAFLQADPMTNQIYVSCSKFEEGQWCQPIRIDNTSLLDGTPQLIVDDEASIWLAYTQTAPETDGTDILDYAKNQRVVVGRIEPKTLEFTKSAEYESIGYAHMPTLEIVDENLILAWNDSNITDANSVLTPNTCNIYYSTCNNNNWSEAKLLTTIEHPICEMTIGDEGIACNIDTDNNLLTYDDLSLTVYQWGGTSQIIATSVTGHISYAKIPGTMEKAFVWNTKDMLVSSDTTVNVSDITNDYVVTDNNIYFSASNSNASNLYVISYENGCWSEVIQLTNGNRYFENLNVTALNGVDYIMGMHTSADITDTCIDVDKNLVWAMVNSVTDLRLDSVTYDDSEINAGDEVIVTAVVSNAGNHAVNGFKILVNDEVLLETNDVLEVGQSKEVSFCLNCPSVATEYKTVVVNMENSLSNDYRKEDNEVTFVLGQANLVLDLSIQEIGNSRTLIASVINQGIEESSGTVTFYDDNNQKIMEQPFETLKSGECALIRCKINGVSGTYHAVVSNGKNENYLFDNEDYLYMDSLTITPVPTMTTEPTITPTVTVKPSVTAATATPTPTVTPTTTPTPIATVSPTPVDEKNTLNLTKYTVSCKTSDGLFKVGDEFILHANAENAIGTPKYMFTYIVNGQEIIVKNYSTENEASFVADVVGTYLFKVYVVDDGNEYCLEFRTGDVVVHEKPIATATQNPDSTVTPTPVVTATPIPTVTETPIVSVQPTVTPTAIPTATPTPTPTITPSISESVPETKTYTIKYVLNKGKNSKWNPSTYNGLSNISLKSPVRKGYIFKGWYTDSNYSKSITKIFKGSTTDYVLYAKWEKVKAPAKPVIKSLTNNENKKVIVKLSKKVKGAKGYQLTYATNSKFTKGKKNVDMKSTSKTISKLKKGKTYYVKVRAYTKDSKGKKVYGNYSNVKKVKIKK